jgi:serine/threonine-protein kinase HipA
VTGIGIKRTLQYKNRQFGFRQKNLFAPIFTKRLAFNVAIGNRDDHLRNHGFILGTQGWRLSPAFDMNPSIDKADHVLNIDDTDNRPNLQTVLSTAAFYGLTESAARAILSQVVQAVQQWRQVAGRLQLGRGDILLMESAFQACTEP